MDSPKIRDTGRDRSKPERIILLASLSSHLGEVMSGSSYTRKRKPALVSVDAELADLQEPSLPTG
jgi:hypothetical protein